MNDAPAPTQRLDKWLWCARFFKSRSLASKLVGAGKLRLDGRVISKASQIVREGEVLTFPQGPHIRVVKVLFLAERRGPAPEAQTLYEDLVPIEPKKPKASLSTDRAPSRERGEGRPTKRDRRALDRLQSGD